VPGVIIGYPAPPRHSPDYYALGMVDVLLTGGPSSRFQLDLVKGKESVIQYQAEIGWPFASSTDYKDPGDYAMFLLFKPNFTPQQIVDQAQQEIAKIQNEGVDMKEMERARTLLRSERITSLQSSLHRAQLLGQYEILDGKPELINTDLEKFLAVTPAQIQAVAKKYLTPERRSILDIIPAPPEGAPHQPKEN
jgi:predicted Zn-dependent peptidase